MTFHLPRLGADVDAPFPDVSTALRRPDGLLAFGGDLRVERLLAAYAQGIFPWYSDGQPILWWSPDPRAVFATDGVRLSSRFRRGVRRSRWRVNADHAFADVVRACATVPRPGQGGTWITAQMQRAYLDLHRLGHAHSIEVYDDAMPDGPRLVGGLYGVAIGRMFFGESMFSAASGGSKAALAMLARWLREHDCPLIDAQVGNDHLQRMGCAFWPREAFTARIRELVAAPPPVAPAAAGWRDAFGVRPVCDLAG